jgi:hypothetical protein
MFEDFAGIFLKVTFLIHTGRIRIQSETSPPYNDILLSRELVRFVGYGKVDVTGHAAFDVNRKMNLIQTYTCTAMSQQIAQSATSKPRTCRYVTFRANTVEPFTSFSTDRITCRWDDASSTPSKSL